MSHWLVDSMFPDPRRPGASRKRSAALLLSLALGATACGASDEAATPTLATDAPAAVSPDADEAQPENDAAAAAPETEGPVSAEEEPIDEEAAPEVAVENLFPDVDVLDIADGSTVNLAAELGGGDKATLLWFWAPH